MNDDKKTAIAIAPKQQIMRPIASPADVLGALDETHALIRGALKEGTDYGTVPGTRGKPTLLKPGAEKLVIAFGCRALYTIVEQEIAHDKVVKYVHKYNGQKESIGLYRYVIRCQLQRPDGQIVGDGLGSCSTLESKYIDRPRDCENTALKMAEKRALVAATLGAFGLSDAFTQDMEDAPVEVVAPSRGHVTPAPPQPPKRDELRDAKEELKAAFVAANFPIASMVSTIKEALGGRHIETVADCETVRAYLRAMPVEADEVES